MNTKSWMWSALGLAVGFNLVHCKDESPDPVEGGATPGQGGMSGSPSVDASDARGGSSAGSGAGGGDAAAGQPEADVRDAAAQEGGADALPGVSTAGEGGGGPAIVDASDGASREANAVATFQSVIGVFNARCVGCHAPGDGGAPSRFLDLQTAVGLYERLIAPLPENQHGYCGVDGGVDGGSAWRAVVPGNPGASLLYVKVAGTQSAACGARMPRVAGRSADGGAISVACDVADGGASNCLSQAEIDTIRNWIAGNAPDR